MPLIHRGKVVKGKFIPCDRTPFVREFAKPDGTELEILVRKPRKSRSPEQNRYYWSVVIALIAEETGFSQDEVHEALKAKFLGDPPAKRGGLWRIRSTTDLSTVEFLEYVAQIQQWSAEFLNCYIPDPNEEWTE